MGKKNDNFAMIIFQQKRSSDFVFKTNNAYQKMLDFLNHLL